MKLREISVRYLPGKAGIRCSEIYRGSQQVFDGFKEIALEPVEIFRVLYLDGKNRMLFYEDVSRGTLSSALVHPREVFWSAVHHRAAAIICIHNHPSGDPQPSGEDQTITRKLKEAGELLGIRLLDHLVIGDGRYFSFRDQGLL